MSNVFIGYYNKANYITFVGLLSSLISCFFAWNHNLRLAVIFIIGAGICDLFDGAVARKIKRTSEEALFGVQLDTVVDVVSFCVTPVIIVYSQIGTSSWYALIIYVFYITSGVIRLAYFNTLAQPSSPVNYYQGLPVTYIALILPIVLLLRLNIATIITLGIVGLLFVINIKIPKPRGIWYILFPLIAVGLIILWCCL